MSEKTSEKMKIYAMKEEPIPPAKILISADCLGEVTYEQVEAIKKTLKPKFPEIKICRVRISEDTTYGCPFPILLSLVDDKKSGVDENGNRCAGETFSAAGARVVAARLIAAADFEEAKNESRG